MSGRRANRGPSEVVADYDVRPPAVRTILTVLGTLVSVAALGALLLGVSILMRDTRVATSQVDVGQNGQIRIEATDADVEIVEGEPDLVTFTSRITSGVRQTDYQLGRRGDTIRIASGCQTWLNPGCGVKVRLQVPPGLPLVIRTAGGDVRAEAIDQGVLTVRTSTGDVTVEDLRVDEFSARTTAGDVRATFARQPFAFKADTGAGDVTATIPDGDRTYAITTDSSTGDVDSDLESDDDGEGFVRVTTGAGDIRLRQGAAADADS